MAILHLSLSPRPLKPPQNPNPTTPKPRILCNSSKRDFILNTASLCAFSLSAHYPVAIAFADTSPSSKSILSAIANTKTWFQFFGDGFSIRVPPEFEDIMEPEVKMVSHSYSYTFCDWLKNCLVELKIQLSVITIAWNFQYWTLNCDIKKPLFDCYVSRISMLDCLFMEIRQSPGHLQLGLHLLMGMQSDVEFLWFCVYILIKWKKFLRILAIQVVLCWISYPLFIFLCYLVSEYVKFPQIYRHSLLHLFFITECLIVWRRSEVLSVVIRPTNQLKITFLEVCALTITVLMIFCSIVKLIIELFLLDEL